MVPSSERNLSPAACSILRAIMHSALLWASCNDGVSTYSPLPAFSSTFILPPTQNAMEGLINLTHSNVKPLDMADFFWRHLEHDIRMLGQALGRNEDDVCLLLHLVLKNIALETPSCCQYIARYFLSILMTNFLSLFSSWNAGLCLSADSQCQGAMGGVVWGGVHPASAECEYNNKTISSTGDVTILGSSEEGAHRTEGYSN